ncbi:hypothetical protein HHL23_13750 [Chryseobacterium sp. RP-3-3]|uniref:Uncharacterized protein n=1 Tax=Chryseobacterium antibioticum TaxID=2728847 RepID=A0A7Y0AP53_9FLAO|nr:hypothetical protein [Chryseobacterium antibioticum]NML70849.1 hypothetical protein [Chryseobacterium antibioticum]
MKIEEIKTRLEAEGYSVMLLKDASLTVGQDDGYDKELGLKMLKNAFGVELKSDLIVADYAIGQIPIEKEFKTIEEFLKFVRQVFPLEG